MVCNVKSNSSRLTLHFFHLCLQPKITKKNWPKTLYFPHYFTLFQKILCNSTKGYKSLTKFVPTSSSSKDALWEPGKKWNSHLICAVNHCKSKNGYHMQCNTWLKWVKQTYPCYLSKSMLLCINLLRKFTYKYWFRVFFFRMFANRC